MGTARYTLTKSKEMKNATSQISQSHLHAGVFIYIDFYYAFIINFFSFLFIFSIKHKVFYKVPICLGTNN